jgi:2-haloalkanoic acid dehalogenase type II
MSTASVITFDCYGTLIDWETGIRNAFRKALEKAHHPAQLAERVIRLYANEEAKVEEESPHLLYRQVLTRTASKVAEKIGWDLKRVESSFLAEDLPNWKPFPDTNPALERLAKKHTLGILSNTDNDLLAGTLKHLSVKFDILVTAENVRSYKPRPRHFEEARRLIGPRPWLHVAASWFHDIEPATKLNIHAAWVNRKNEPPTKDKMFQRVQTFRDLAELADWHNC